MHDFDDIRKILVIKLRHIGDVILSEPAFRALREKFPDAHIAALVNSGTEEVLEGNPSIDEIIIFDRSIKRKTLLTRYLKELSFLRQVRAWDFDMTIDLTSGDRAAIISFISGARYRLAYDPGDNGFLGKRYLYTHLAKRVGSQHMVLQNLNVVRQFGISADNIFVDFFIPEGARMLVKRVFEENNINKTFMYQKDSKDNENYPSPIPLPDASGEGMRGRVKEIFLGGNDKIVHIHPTSRWLFKCWKDEYMAEVIKWLLEQGIKVVITSAPDKKEMDKAKRILSLIGNSPDSTVSSLVTKPALSLTKGHSSLLIDLCGKTTIKQLAAISAASDLFIGVDSAPMHIAAAVGTPVMAFFGPSGAFNWGPWDNSQKTSASSVEPSEVSRHMRLVLHGKSSCVRTVARSQRSEEIPYQKRNGIQTCGKHTVIQKDWECVPCGKDGCNSTKISRCLEDIKPEEIKNILAEKLGI